MSSRHTALAKRSADETAAEAVMAGGARACDGTEGSHKEGGRDCWTKAGGLRPCSQRCGERLLVRRGGPWRGGLSRARHNVGFTVHQLRCEHVGLLGVEQHEVAEELSKGGGRQTLRVLERRDQSVAQQLWVRHSSAGQPALPSDSARPRSRATRRLARHLPVWRSRPRLKRAERSAKEGHRAVFRVKSGLSAGAHKTRAPSAGGSGRTRRGGASRRRRAPAP
eukprot:5120402-Prymnesium_polylepis.1